MNARFVRATGDFVQSTVPHIARPATPKDSAIARMVSTFELDAVRSLMDRPAGERSVGHAH